MLNTLIQVNHDRAEAYVKAANQLKDSNPALKTIMGQMTDQSLEFAGILAAKVGALKGNPATGTTVSGKLHRVFMDLKWTFTGADRGAILTSCYAVEQAALKTYNSSLLSDAEMSAATRQMLISQRDIIASIIERIEIERSVHAAMLV